MKLIFTCFALTACLFGPVTGANHDPAKPNVVILYFDDMGWGDMGANQATGLAIPAGSSPSPPTPCSRDAVGTGLFRWKIDKALAA